MGLLAAVPGLAVRVHTDVTNGTISWWYLPLVATSIGCSWLISWAQVRIVVDLIKRLWVLAAVMASSVLAMVMMWTATALHSAAVDDTSAASRLSKFVATMSVLLVPLLLPCRVFRAGYTGNGWLPGTSVRWMAWRHIDGYTILLHRRLGYCAPPSPVATDADDLSRAKREHVVARAIRKLRTEYRHTTGHGFSEPDSGQPSLSFNLFGVGVVRRASMLVGCWLS